MASVYGLSFTWAVTTPTANAWAEVARTEGLLEYNKAIGTANLIGAVGGTLDIVIQTNYGRGLGQSGAGFWKDLARFNQLAASAAAISWNIVLTRGIGGTLNAPSATNTIDGPLGGYTPTIAVNTIIPQQLGDTLRLLVLPGAGTTAGAALSFAFDSSP